MEIAQQILNFSYTITVFVLLPYLVLQILPSRKWLYVIYPSVLVLVLRSSITLVDVINSEDAVSFPFATIAFFIASSLAWGGLIRIVTLYLKKKDVTLRNRMLVVIIGFFVSPVILFFALGSCIKWSLE